MANQFAPFASPSVSPLDRDVRPEGTHIRRLALVTDAWHPQTNGVANTLARVVKYLESQGTRVLVIAPEDHRTLALPSYPEIRIAWDPWKATRRIQDFAPDAVHVATEGPLGIWASGWLHRRDIAFTSSFHTRYPEYLSARMPVPLDWGYRVERWFHGRAQNTFVGTMSLLRELRERGIGRRLVHWPRGIDVEMYHPNHRQASVYEGLPGPIWLYVGRVAVEKSLEDFLSLSLPGTKVIVGDGPSRESLQRRFPNAIWRGYRYGADLAAHYASADCFVFPSRTETFGNVLLEALASGLPVASVPAPGPSDLIEEGRNGSLGEDLLAACHAAIGCSREMARASALPYTWLASHERFRAHLVSLRPEPPMSMSAAAPVIVPARPLSATGVVAVAG